jgi:hypothetical protein
MTDVNATVSTFRDSFHRTGMTPYAWRVCRPHCSHRPATAHLTGSSNSICHGEQLLPRFVEWESVPLTKYILHFWAVQVFYKKINFEAFYAFCGNFIFLSTVFKALGKKLAFCTQTVFRCSWLSYRSQLITNIGTALHTVQGTVTIVTRSINEYTLILHYRLPI